MTSWNQWAGSMTLPAPKKIRCVLWHRHGSKLTTGVAEHRVGIQPWPEGEAMPERDNAFAYQVGYALQEKNEDNWWRPVKFVLEEGDIGPMVYFGVPKIIDGVSYCEDQRGELHELGPGETIEPVKKGQIVVSHYGVPDLPGEEE